MLCQRVREALLSLPLVTAMVFGVSPGPASADTLLTTFGTSPFVQATAPEWLWDGPASELTLLANGPAYYWEQTSFGGKDIIGAVGVSLQARFWPDYGFDTSNDSFIVRLVSGDAGIAKAEAVFDFFEFQGAQTTVAKAFTHVDNDFNYADVQIIYLIGNSNVPYNGDHVASITLDRLTAVTALPEPPTYGMALAGIACGGFSMWRRRKRA